MDPADPVRPPSPGRAVRAAPLAVALGAAGVLLLLAGLAAGAQGWSLDFARDAELIAQIRAPRSLGAWLAGALLGLAGALAQGLFRNPLADPYLLGSAAGAGLGVVLALAGGGALGLTAGAVAQAGVVAAAFGGALAGVALALALAGGAGRPTVLLLAGVAVGVVLTALSDLVLASAPEALRGRQAFLVGTTGFLGWDAVAWLGAALAVGLALGGRHARVLDALVLGEAQAASLGLPLAQLRLLLVALLALCTGSAVAQVGLVAFVGLAAPHLVRQWAVVTHAPLLALSALAGGALLLAADVLARSAVAPREWPVGIVTALVGGVYLLVLLRRRAGAGA
jgi:iron complex transport system permease protein